ncbi:MAG: hypothetical protein QOH21_2626 [Acidobacteriota bacterium]|jgi:hypothetical protein|nr:hypothetical protein [Acidobacteriota bacterium]
MLKQMVAVDGFDAAVAALGDSAKARRSVAAAILRLRRNCGNWPKIPGTHARVLRTHGNPELLSLSLYYRVDGDVIHLYDVQLAGED